MGLQKKTYCVWISISAVSSVPMIIEVSLDLGDVPKLVNKDFSLTTWKESFNLIKVPPLRMVNSEIVIVDDIMPLFIGIGDLHGCAWIGNIENIAVDILLCTSYTVRCQYSIFPTEWKVGFWQSRPAAINTVRMATNLIYSIMKSSPWIPAGQTTLRTVKTIYDALQSEHNSNIHGSFSIN